MPNLVVPTTAVKTSYLDGEREAAVDEGLDSAWIDDAAADFDAFVAQRSGERVYWDVPVTELWYVDGTTYIGTVVIRHHLTPALELVGGHVGYHVVPHHRRHGHATRMLAEALLHCRRLGIRQVLVTCSPDNVASRRVIEANGGVLEDIRDEARYVLKT